MNPPDFNLSAVSLLMPYSIFSPSWEHYTYSSKQLQGTNNRQHTERERERGGKRERKREQIIPHQHCTWLRQLSGASLDERTKLIKKKKGCVSVVSICACRCACACLFSRAVSEMHWRLSRHLQSKHRQPGRQNARCKVQCATLLIS